MKKLIFAIIGASIICGCGTSYMVKSADKPTITPKADTATLVIIRELCFYGGGVLFTNYLDRKLIGETLGCTYFITEVPPGPHYVISTAENTGVAHFDFKPHKVYYLGQSIVPGLLRGRTGGFYPMALQQAEDAMKKSTYFRIDPKANAKDLDAEVFKDAVAGYETGIKDHPEAYKELLEYDGQ